MLTMREMDGPYHFVLAGNNITRYVLLEVNVTACLASYGLFHISMLYESGAKPV